MKLVICIVIVWIFFLVIRIGFQFETYTFLEPDVRTLIQEVTLVKEDNRITEQTHAVIITFTDQSAVREQTSLTSFDYGLEGGNDTNTQQNIFPPQSQNISIYFFLNPDDSPEGTESFQVSLRSDLGFPAFENPLNLSTNAQIIILDNDCKCYAHNNY